MGRDRGTCRRPHGRPARSGWIATTTWCMTGKRHDFRADYEVGFDDDGRDPRARNHDGVALRLFGRPVRRDQRPRHVPCRQRLLPAGRLRSRTKRMKTNTVSNTAFRGFGGPQGMIGRRAHDGRDRLAARSRSARRAQAQFLRRAGRDGTPYGMVVEDNILPALIDELRARSDYRAPARSHRGVQRRERDPEARASR